MTWKVWFGGIALGLPIGQASCNTGAIPLTVIHDNLEALSRPPRMIVPVERRAEFNEWCQESEIPEADLNRWDSAYVAVQERFLEECTK